MTHCHHRRPTASWAALPFPANPAARSVGSMQQLVRDLTVPPIWRSFASGRLFIQPADPLPPALRVN